DIGDSAGCQAEVFNDIHGARCCFLRAEPEQNTRSPPVFSSSEMASIPEGFSFARRLMLWIILSSAVITVVSFFVSLIWLTPVCPFSEAQF
ncbi:MAG: hypothetical protein IJH98_03095, partial [Solobacterium sp.]|nr:hypothetical protein [Solobacterium sp.]